MTYDFWQEKASFWSVFKLQLFNLINSILHFGVLIVDAGFGGHIVVQCFEFGQSQLLHRMLDNPYQFITPSLIGLAKAVHVCHSIYSPIIVTTSFLAPP